MKMEAGHSGSGTDETRSVVEAFRFEVDIFFFVAEEFPVFLSRLRQLGRSLVTREDSRRGQEFDRLSVGRLVREQDDIAVDSSLDDLELCLRV